MHHKRAAVFGVALTSMMMLALAVSSQQTLAAPAPAASAKPSQSDVVEPMGAVELHSSKTKVNDSGLPPVDTGTAPAHPKKSAKKPAKSAKATPHPKATPHG